jgi:hypothetical protein
VIILAKTKQPEIELHLICASCDVKLGKFTELPKTPNWKDCKVEPVAPVLQLVPGSSQVCPLCGEYFLIKNSTRPCKECGHLIPVPAGGVMTDRGPLDQFIGLASGGVVTTSLKDVLPPIETVIPRNDLAKGGETVEG